MSDVVRFQTFSPALAKVIAVITLLLGLGGMIFALSFISAERYMGGIMGAMFALIWVALGGRGPSSVVLYEDRLMIRRGAWKSPENYLLTDIKELHFDSNKKGKYFEIRTADRKEMYPFNQPATIIRLFSEALEKLRVRVSGKR